ISIRESRERRAWLKSLLKSAEAVLPVSHSFANLYRDHGIERVTAIPNGVSDKAPRNVSRTPPADGRVVIGHIGGMSAHKGFDLLREAVESTRLDNLAMLVVDHGREHGYRYRAYWGEVPVTFVGRYPQDRISELYAQID